MQMQRWRALLGFVILWCDRVRILFSAILSLKDSSCAEAPAPPSGQSLEGARTQDSHDSARQHVQVSGRGQRMYRVPGPRSRKRGPCGWSPPSAACPERGEKSAERGSDTLKIQGRESKKGERKSHAHSGSTAKRKRNTEKQQQQRKARQG